MDKPLINHHQAIQGLRLAVAERGRDHIDPLAEAGDCRYVVNGKPACIGGTALFKVGIPVDELRAWEGNGIDSMMPGITTYGGERGNADGFLSVRAAAVLEVAQDRQDNGSPWGEALDAAEAKYRKITEEEGRR